MRKAKAAEGGAQFVRFFGPLLNALRSLGGTGTPDEVVQQIARDLDLSAATQDELLPGGELRYRNQVAWARFYLAQAGLLDSSKRGVWRLSAKGQITDLSAEQAREIFLAQVRRYQAERSQKVISAADPTEEVVAEALGAPSNDYRSRTLQVLLSLSPSGFERLAQRLLRESGFTQVVVTGQSRDGGIDGYGTLQINPLVTFKVLFQCKRYKDSVTPSQVRDFRGAMAGRADKGIVLTTGMFTFEARKEASRDGVVPIELIDGERLVDMLQTLELGLKPVVTYELDESFFEPFRQ